MRVDSNFFCTVPMPDAGDPSIPATARRFGNDSVIETYKNLVEWAKTADQLGFDTMWLTEHHFQYEGYEVLPNLILFGLHLAMLDQGLRLGQMFNVVPQWHPLRLAEDFALADILTGGRMEFGVGRGTVPREAWAFGTVVASRRQRDVGRARPDQPRDLRRVDGGHQARLVPTSVQLPRQALRPAARRRARPRHDASTTSR